MPDGGVFESTDGDLIRQVREATWRAIGREPPNLDPTTLDSVPGYVVGHLCVAIGPDSKTVGPCSIAVGSRVVAPPRTMVVDVDWLARARRSVDDPAWAGGATRAG